MNALRPGATAWIILLASAGVLSYTALRTAIHHYYAVPLGDPPGAGELFLWQFAIWSYWILAAPMARWLMDTTAGLDRGRARVVGWSVAGLFAVLGSHALWSGQLTYALSPYVTHGNLPGAYGYSLRSVLALDVFLYGTLLVGVLRSRSVTPTFDATADGLLRTRRGHATAGEGSEDPMLESTPGPVIVYRPDDLQILAVNQAAVDQYGWSAREFTARSLLSIRPTEDFERVRANLMRTRQLPVWRAHSRHQRKDGSIFEIELTNHAILFHGEWARMLLITDVTAVARAREALLASERHAAELRVQLANAQLRALKLQLRPHFLFNTLNTVAMMIRNGDHDAAQEMIAMLGDVFRHVLEFEGTDTVPLAQELGFLNLYIGLQQHRFAGRMEVRQDIDQALLETELPALILQPLVENAIHHGVARSSSGCRIDIVARRENGSMVVEVINDAQDAGGAPERGFGVGISNTEARLAELYGDRASFRLERIHDRFRSSLKLPI